MALDNKKIKQTRTKIGDIFEVCIDDNTKKYFQFVALDLNQLNSDVIRIFKKKYTADTIIDINEIIKGEAESHLHTSVKAGIKMGLWNKVGTSENIGKPDIVLFRDSSDYGNPSIKISENWWIWRINQPQQRVGKLTGLNQEAFIGIVINPASIIDILKGNPQPFVYPQFE